MGESGSGKSVSSLTVMGLTRFTNARIEGEIMFEGRDLLKASDEDMRKIRGNEIAMIFQDPLSSLHPYYKVGKQLVEAIRAHHPETSKQPRARARSSCSAWSTSPSRSGAIDNYPHEFSGGMRQRAMIAMALSNDPKLLIADEPTTALDVTVQAQILALIRRLQRELNTAVVIITHDLGVIAETADDVAVMYAGRIVERAPTERIFDAARAPLHVGPAALDPAARRAARRPARADPGPAAEPDQPAERLLVPPALPVRAPDATRRSTRRSSRCPGERDHSVACLLPSEIRKRIWAELREGKDPAEVREHVALEEKPA